MSSASKLDLEKAGKEGDKTKKFLSKLKTKNLLGLQCRPIQERLNQYKCGNFESFDLNFMGSAHNLSGLGAKPGKQKTALSKQVSYSNPDLSKAGQYSTQPTVLLGGNDKNSEADKESPKTIDGKTTSFTLPNNVEILREEEVERVRRLSLMSPVKNPTSTIRSDFTATHKCNRNDRRISLCGKNVGICLPTALNFECRHSRHSPNITCGANPMESEIQHIPNNPEEILQPVAPNYLKPNDPLVRNKRFPINFGTSLQAHEPSTYKNFDSMNDDIDNNSWLSKKLKSNQAKKVAYNEMYVGTESQRERMMAKETEYEKLYTEISVYDEEQDTEYAVKDIPVDKIDEDRSVEMTTYEKSVAESSVLTTDGVKKQNHSTPNLINFSTTETYTLARTTVSNAHKSTQSLMTPKMSRKFNRSEPLKASPPLQQKPLLTFTPVSLNNLNKRMQPKNSVAGQYSTSNLDKLHTHPELIPSYPGDFKNVSQDESPDFNFRPLSRLSNFSNPITKYNSTTSEILSKAIAKEIKTIQNNYGLDGVRDLKATINLLTETSDVINETFEANDGSCRGIPPTSIRDDAFPSMLSTSGIQQDLSPEDLAELKEGLSQIKKIIPNTIATTRKNLYDIRNSKLFHSDVNLSKTIVEEEEDDQFEEMNNFTQSESCRRKTIAELSEIDPISNFTTFESHEIPTPTMCTSHIVSKKKVNKWLENKSPLKLCSTKTWLGGRSSDYVVTSVAEIDGSYIDHTISPP